MDKNKIAFTNTGYGWLKYEWLNILTFIALMSGAYIGIWSSIALGFKISASALLFEFCLWMLYAAYKRSKDE